MIARGKREAKRARRPWLSTSKRGQGLKGRNKRRRIRPFRAESLVNSLPGATRFALALAVIFRAVGAVALLAVKSRRTRCAKALDDFVAVGAGGGFDGGFVEG
jgi:hypothetical protein